MLRTIIIALFALFSGAAVAAGNMAQSAVGYECTQIKKAETGFSCSLDKMAQFGMQIHFFEDPQKMTKARRAASVYKSNMMNVRFYQAGGSTITVTADYWEKDKAVQCRPTRGGQTQLCLKCRGKDEHGDWKCE